MAIHKNDQTVTPQQAPQPAKVEANENRLIEEEYNNMAQADAARAQQQQQQERNMFQQQFNNMAGGTQAHSGNNNSGSSAISSLMETLYKPFSSGSLNERAIRILEIFKEHYRKAHEASPMALDVNFIQAPGNKISHIHGGIVVAIPVTGPAGNVQVTAHLVIVETNAVIPNSQPINYRGQQFAFQNTASSSVTADTMEAMEKLVRQHYVGEGIKDFEVINASFTVLPLEVSLEDVTTLHRIVEYVAAAAFTRLQMHNFGVIEDESVAIAAAAATKAVRLVANIEENPAVSTDVTGQLIRSDFKIKTNMVANQLPNQHYALEALELGQVDTYCSPVYAEPNAGMGMQFNGMWGRPQTQHYYNQVVLTDLRTGPELRMSIGTAALLIATTSCLAVNGVWKRAYIPNRHLDPAQLDIRDIGAIGYEVPKLNPNNQPGETERREAIKTKGADFTNERFNQLMDVAFHQDLMYCIDVPDGHYMLSLFLSEAEKPAASAARSMIYKAINALTGGKFSELFSMDEQMFATTGQRNPVGYYQSGGNGKLRPLADVDHLAMLNITAGDSEWLRMWEEFESPNFPQELRLTRRNEILQQFADNKAVIKGYSTRIVLLPKFMKALTSALVAVELYPQLNTTIGQVDTFARATASQFANLVVDPTGLPNVFMNNTSAFNNYQSANNFMAGWRPSY